MMRTGAGIDRDSSVGDGEVDTEEPAVADRETVAPRDHSDGGTFESEGVLAPESSEVTDRDPSDTPANESAGARDDLEFDDERAVPETDESVDETGSGESIGEATASESPDVSVEGGSADVSGEGELANVSGESELADVSEAGDSRDDADPDEISLQDLSPELLLVNVALSQGLLAGVLVAAAWYTEIPFSALGIGGGVVVGASAVAVGLGLGLALYVANEIGAVALERVGIDHAEELREMLAPGSARGWAVLLFVVLPIIAIFEELLFRAALIGALSAGFAISPWVLVVLSSVAFALGHGTQGTGGIVVTGALGLVLGAAFVLTGSLLVVVVAHYLVNALEFVVHERLEIEWIG